MKTSAILVIVFAGLAVACTSQTSSNEEDATSESTDSLSGDQCWKAEVYASYWGSYDCYTNSPGATPFPGQGTYMCDTTYCKMGGGTGEKTNARRNCRLLYCTVGTRSGY